MDTQIHSLAHVEETMSQPSDIYTLQIAANAQTELQKSAVPKYLSAVEQNKERNMGKKDKNLMMSDTINSSGCGEMFFMLLLNSCDLQSSSGNNCVRLDFCLVLILHT